MRMIASHRKLSFLVAAALLCLMACVAVRALLVNMREFDRMAQKQTDYSYLRRLLSAMKDAETGERGFLLTANSRFLEPYNTGIVEATRLLRESSRAFAKDYPGQMGDLSASVQNELLFLAGQIKLASSGHPDEAKLSADYGKTIMDHIRSVVKNISDIEANNLAAKQLHLQRLGRESIAAVCLGLAFALMLIGFATVNMLRDLKARIEAEVGLRQIQQDLEELVRARTRDLAQSNERLQINIQTLEQEIEERRRLEGKIQDRTTELSRSEERFRSLIEGVKDSAILMLDVDGKIGAGNPGAERILGYSTEEIAGKHFSCFYPDAEREKENFQRELEIAGETGQFSGEGWRIRKDGTRFWANVVVSALRNEDGSFRGFSKVMRDVTERQRAKELLERRSAELAAANDLLSIQTQRAEKANQAKSEFLAAMSHEIRTPMNAILGMSDLLWDSSLTPEQREYVDVFRRAGANLLTLINDILDLSKIESGHFELEQVEFDLADLLNRTTELILPKANAKNLKLVCDLSPDVHTAMIGDPTRLQQIFVNLLGNAVKFTEKGKIELSIVPDRERPELLTFSVSDTGIGIAPDHLEKIFDDFTQADASTTRKFGGTGLGLGICKRLVNRMGGDLTVESTLGQGTTFRFAAVFGKGTKRSVAPSAPMEDFNGRRVLVVDDNATNRTIIREILASWGLQSTDCDRAASAVPEFAAGLRTKNAYAAVIVDCQMPEVDGFTTLQLIRDIAPDIPVIMLTSDKHPGDATRCQKLGVGYAEKPVNRAELVRLLLKALGKPQSGSSAAQASAAELPSYAGDGCPLRLLIADDSADNRLLMEAYLKREPYAVTFAENGRIALDYVLTAGPFDLVLMDMQMPVMDGLTAVRSIRKAEQERGTPPMPIIALTANALARDARESLEAGCDSHLTKPISKQKLIAAIEQVRSARVEMPMSEATAVMDIPPGLEDYAKEYILKHRREFAALEGMLSQGNFDDLQRAAHDMKGTGAAFGFPEVTRIASSIETAAKEKDSLVIGQQLVCLAGYLQRASEYVKTEAVVVALQT